MISSQLELLRLNTGRVVPVRTANTLLKQMLFRYQGHISAALVLGGVDNSGPQLYCIHPHGSTFKGPYVTMGSGSLAAMSVFEARWRPDLPEEEAKKLVRDAIAAGVFNDLGSGSNVDLCVIKKDSATYLRGYELANVKGERTVSQSMIFFFYVYIFMENFTYGFIIYLKLNYDYKSGTTAVLESKVHKLDITESVQPIVAGGSGITPMDTA